MFEMVIVGSRVGGKLCFLGRKTVVVPF